MEKKHENEEITTGLAGGCNLADGEGFSGQVHAETDEANDLEILAVKAAKEATGLTQEEAEEAEPAVSNHWLDVYNTYLVAYEKGEAAADAQYKATFLPFQEWAVDPASNVPVGVNAALECVRRARTLTRLIDALAEAGVLHHYQHVFGASGK